MFSLAHRGEQHIQKSADCTENQHFSYDNSRAPLAGAFVYNFFCDQYVFCSAHRGEQHIQKSADCTENQHFSYDNSTAPLAGAFADNCFCDQYVFCSARRGEQHIKNWIPGSGNHFSIGM
nr:unnamed protein product [Callosobruchus analis]